MNKKSFVPSKIRECQRGFLLVSSYLVLSSLMTLTLALWMRGVGLINQSENALYQMEAFHLAESGLDVAIVNLESDIDYSGASASYVKDGVTVGNYNVVVETPDQSNPFRKKVTSTGTTTDIDGAGRGEMDRTIVAYVDLIPRKTFDFAVFAKESIDLSGSQSVVVDSYDSAFGPYSAMTSRQNAEVMTNSVQNGAVELSGNVDVRGDVTVGTGGDPASGILVGNNSNITGTTGAAVSNKDYESINEVPKSAIPMGDVTLASKDSLMLDGGTYVFDSLDMSGKSSIEFTGPATVYLRGPAYIAGNGIVTAETHAKNLMVHVMGEQTLTYAGNGDLHAGLYAPDSHVDISGNGSIHGGVVAKTFYQHGSGHFHYDEDLKRQDANAKLRAEIVSWQESNKFLS